MPCVLAASGRKDVLERKGPASRKARSGALRWELPGTLLTHSRGCQVSFFCRYRLCRPETSPAPAAGFGSIHCLIGVSLECGGFFAVDWAHGNSHASGSRRWFGVHVESILKTPNPALASV